MQYRSRVRHHKTPAQKAEFLAAYERSGLSQREFAAQHGTALSTLQRWMHKSQSGQGAKKAGLVEVPNLFGGGPAAGAYRVCFPRGLILEVASGFQPGELQSVVQLLQNL